MRQKSITTNLHSCISIPTRCKGNPISTSALTSELARTRKALRARFRQQRQQLSQAEQLIASRQMCAHLIALIEKLPRKPNVCAGYLCNDGEIDLSPFFKYCWQRDIVVAIPVLHPFASGQLLFQRYSHNTLMRPNRYEIEEPVWDCTQVLPLAHIDALVMPLVGFDEKRHRLGMGGGYYDRSLAKIDNYQTKPLLIGAAHAFQRSEELLPVAPWDKHLDEVVTPDGVL